MEKKLLTEELYNMKYLFGYQRGVVVSEQKSKKVKYDWKEGTNGNLDLSTNNPSIGDPFGINLAINVKYDEGVYNITSMTSAVRLTDLGSSKPGTPPGKTPEPIFTQLKLKDSLFPYPDNMVKPKFDKYPDAKSAYDEFIKKIVDFLSVANTSKLPTFTIQGTADAARPTLDIPSGYSSLDHSDTPPYAGETDPSKMNQYLADNRGIELGKIIIQDVLDKTGQDITNKIKYKTGVNYYGQQGKRGSEFRMVTVKPSSTEVNVDLGSEISKTPGTKGTQGSKQASPEIKYNLNIGGVEVPAKILKDGTTGILLSDSENFDDNTLPTWNEEGLNGNAFPSSSIENGEIFIGGISFGKFLNDGEFKSKFGKSLRQHRALFGSEGKITKKAIRDGYVILQLIHITLTN